MSDNSAPRLAPLTREQCGEDVRAALAHAYSDEVAARFLSPEADAPPLPNVLATLMHHPALMGPFLVYNNALLQTPTIPARLRELMILRVASRTDAPYEWAQHVRLAARVGITPDEIATVASAGPFAADASGAWSPLEADALAATDQLIDAYRIDDETWARLAAQLEERQLVELVFVVGTYTGLAMAFNSFRLRLDPDLEEAAATPTPRVEE